MGKNKGIYVALDYEKEGDIIQFLESSPFSKKALVILGLRELMKQDSVSVSLSNNLNAQINTRNEFQEPNNSANSMDVSSEFDTPTRVVEQYKQQGEAMPNMPNDRTVSEKRPGNKIHRKITNGGILK
ncbi:hypothetical protein [Ligilactobacillus equi]|uniref:Small conductance mechanosensitive ion channel n=2 Tax=Ligilactobacillus equi TaxID=137357 RepID=V7HWF8_9LACO|nr:hypothetical protein [Ligilactobacillus equi]ETA74589.1 small conductance mechanosensitive ion channel [Ligilactobacillus equi DPC 6820]KRL84369.1 hypothetical protein FC36_GL000292 [Ligilactobacillus equi DSM 15833 = JCM 10991]